MYTQNPFHCFSPSLWVLRVPPWPQFAPKMNLDTILSFFNFLWLKIQSRRTLSGVQPIKRKTNTDWVWWDEFLDEKRGEKKNVTSWTASWKEILYLQALTFLTIHNIKQLNQFLLSSCGVKMCLLLVKIEIAGLELTDGHGRRCPFDWPWCP